MYRVGRDTKLSVTAVVRAAPSTSLRSRGAVALAALIVCGISGSPASFSEPTDTYAVALERRGSLTDPIPFTEKKVLVGARDSRPLDGVTEMSVTRNGLSNVAVVASLW